MKKRNLRSEISIVVLIVVLFAVFSFMSAEFFTWKNIALILKPVHFDCNHGNWDDHGGYFRRYGSFDWFGRKSYGNGYMYSDA